MSQETTRKCLVCGQILPKEDLLRFTCSPDDRIIPDFKKKLPGRGLYVCNKQSMLKQAIENNLFAKATKRRTKVNTELLEQVMHLLRKQALDAISLARKAGALVIGQDKVLDLLHKKQVAFIIVSAEAGNDGRKKIIAAAKETEVFSLFKIEELDKELAKESTVYLAIAKGPMANMVKTAILRLTSFLNN